MKNRNPLKYLLLSALFAALTAIGAFLRIPVGHSSFSLQFFFTCMAGLLLGPYWGAASQLIYVLLAPSSNIFSYIAYTLENHAAAHRMHFVHFDFLVVSSGENECPLRGRSFSFLLT